MNVEEFHSSYVRNKHTGCWIWIRGLTSDGYGSLKWNGVSALAHRVMYALMKGTTPGKVIDHVCRVRRCVNPEHLREVDVLTNTLENSIAIPAINAMKEHCPKCGREYTYRKSSDRTSGRKRVCYGCEHKRRKRREGKGDRRGATARRLLGLHEPQPDKGAGADQDERHEAVPTSDDLRKPDGSHP